MNAQNSILVERENGTYYTGPLEPAEAHPFPCPECADALRVAFLAELIGGNTRRN